MKEGIGQKAEMEANDAEELITRLVVIDLAQGVISLLSY